MHKSKISSVLIVLILVALAGGFSYWRNKQSPQAAVHEIEKHFDQPAAGINSNLKHATNTPGDNIQQALVDQKTVFSPSEVVEGYNKEWLNFEKAILAQSNFEMRVQAMYLGLQSLQQRTRVMTDANLDLKISSELMISVLKVIPENQNSKTKCADYLRKVFIEFDPNAFKSDIFEKSWGQNRPEEPSVKRAYQLMVQMCH